MRRKLRGSSLDAVHCVDAQTAHPGAQSTQSLSGTPRAEEVDGVQCGGKTNLQIGNEGRRQYGIDNRLDGLARSRSCGSPRGVEINTGAKRRQCNKTYRLEDEEHL